MDKNIFLNLDGDFFCVEARSFLEPEFLVKTEEELDVFSRQKVFGIIVRLGKVLDQRYLSKFPALSVIGSMTTGLDHIDLDYCREHQITVISLRGENDFLKMIPSTAEMTWGLLLSLTRKIPQAIHHVNAGGWRSGDLFGFNLAGKKIGLIGFGRVAQQVGAYAHAFGMTVLAHDRLEKPIERNEAYPVSLMDLSVLLETVDIVSVHLELNAETENFIRREHFGKMKIGAFFLNTSRGRVVDEEALLWALEEGPLSGAAVDVICAEENFGKNILVNYAKQNSRLLVTPHIAGSTYESMKETSVFISKKIRGHVYGCSVVRL